MSKEKRYYVPPEIEKLRTELCAGFIATGELDQATLARLHIYAADVRGKPRVELTPEETTERLIEFVRPRKRKLVPRNPEYKRRPLLKRVDGRTRNIGRQKGSRFLIVDGIRKLVPMMEIENAIRNGARYPVRAAPQSESDPYAAARSASAGDGDRVDDSVSHPIAEHGAAEG